MRQTGNIPIQPEEIKGILNLSAEQLQWHSFRVPISEDGKIVISSSELAKHFNIEESAFVIDDKYGKRIRLVLTTFYNLAEGKALSAPSEIITGTIFDVGLQEEFKKSEKARPQDRLHDGKPMAEVHSYYMINLNLKNPRKSIFVFKYQKGQKMGNFGPGVSKMLMLRLPNSAKRMQLTE